MYFEGKVQSLGLATPEGPATLGVITPGRYAFSADVEEHVLILTGSLRVRLPGQAWRSVPPNDAYMVPAGAAFEVEASIDVGYLCRYLT